MVVNYYYSKNDLKNYKKLNVNKKKKRKRK